MSGIIFLYLEITTFAGTSDSMAASAMEVSDKVYMYFVLNPLLSAAPITMAHSTTITEQQVNTIDPMTTSFNRSPTTTFATEQPSTEPVSELANSVVYTAAVAAAVLCLVLLVILTLIVTVLLVRKSMRAIIRAKTSQPMSGTFQPMSDQFDSTQPENISTLSDNAGFYDDIKSPELSPVPYCIPLTTKIPVEANVAYVSIPVEANAAYVPTPHITVKANAAYITTLSSPH